MAAGSGMVGRLQRKNMEAQSIRKKAYLSSGQYPEQKDRAKLREWL